MNVKKARNLLGFSEKDEITEESLKKQYRKMALIHHPDKNTEADTSSRFQEINAAYTYLLPIYQCDAVNESEAEEEELPDMPYATLLFHFLKKFNRVSLSSVQNRVFYKILEKISGACREKILHVLEQLDRSILIKMYEIFKEHREILHFSSSLLDEIGEILRRKIERMETIILNPFLEDLLECNLYKFTVDGVKYIIPLWHSELVYDHSGNDLRILCNPIIPDNMYIDSKNNVHIQMESKITDIWSSIHGYGGGNYTVSLTESGKYDVVIKDANLTMQKKQTFVFGGRGIPRIHGDNIYNVDYRGDIIVYLTIL